MAKDSLTYLNYYRIALWLSGRLDSTLVRLQKRTPEPVSAPTLGEYTPLDETAHEPVFCPEDMQLPEEEQKLLWNAFYATKEEA
jgi:hypothetical protein